MSSDLFKKEVVEQIGTLDRWCRWGSRKVRAFFKGPEAGINPETGVIVLAHGMGGRQNDISWKRLRKDLADQCNAVVLGVNYSGTASLERDIDFITQQVTAYEPALLHFARASKVQPGEELDLTNSEFTYFENQMAAVQAAIPFAWDFWDYGFLQAFDILNALSWLRSQTESAELPLDWQRVHLLSRSAGSQVCYNLLKLAPNTFAGLADIGGIAYVGESLGDLAFAIEDPFGRINERDTSWFTVSGDHLNIRFNISRRVPTGNFRAQLPGAPTLSDQIQVRLVDYAPHFESGTTNLAHLRILHGADDEAYPPKLKRKLAQFHADRGCLVEMQEIGRDDLDNHLYDNTGHTFMKDFNAIATEVCGELFMKRREGAATDIGSHTARMLAGKNGRWLVQLTDHASCGWEPNAPA